jgi:hypothetical protein
LYLAGIRYTGHRKQYTIHSAQYTVQFNFSLRGGPSYTWLGPGKQCTEDSTQYTVHSTQYTAHSTQCSSPSAWQWAKLYLAGIRYAVHSRQYTRYSTQYTVQFTFSFGVSQVIPGWDQVHNPEVIVHIIQYSSPSLWEWVKWSSGSRLGSGT